MTPVREMDDTAAARREAILSYLKAMDAFVPDSDFGRLLVDGRWYTPQVLPKPWKYGKWRECYTNAGRAAVADGRYTYVEGFAVAGPLFPVQHAWLADADGNVIDLTWRTRKGGKHFTDPADMAYYGIPFTQKELFAKIARTGMWGMLLGNDLDRVHREYDTREEGSA